MTGFAGDPGHANDIRRESLDPARGLRPACNPAFAATHASHVPRRRGGAFWPRAAIGIAVAVAAWWWFAAHGPPHHEGALGSAPTNRSAQSETPQASKQAGLQAAKADLLESLVMALAAQMSAPAARATEVPPKPPAVAEKAAPPHGAAGTTSAPAASFSAVGSLTTRWRHEQAQLVTAERKLCRRPNGRGETPDRSSADANRAAASHAG